MVTNRVIMKGIRMRVSIIKDSVNHKGHELGECGGGEEKGEEEGGEEKGGGEEGGEEEEGEE